MMFRNVFRRFLGLLLSASLLLAGTPAPVFAQETVQFADLSAEQKRNLAELVDKAKAAYNRGSFEESLRSFQAAYDIFPHPDMLYRMGLCYERLDEFEAAADHYKKFLAKVPDAPERQRIERIIESLSSRISKAEIVVTTVPDKAVVYINDISNISGTTPTEFPVAPGTHLIIVKKDGYLPIEEQVSIKAGETLQLRYQLSRDYEEKPSGEVAEDRPVERSNPNTTQVITLTAVGIGATITSIVFFSFYADKREELDQLEAQPRNQVSRDRLNDTESSMYTNLALGVITAGIATSALLWAYIAWKDGEEAKSASLDGPFLGPSDDGWRAGWSLSF